MDVAVRGRENTKGAHTHAKTEIDRALSPDAGWVAFRSERREQLEAAPSSRAVCLQRATRELEHLAIQSLPRVGIADKRDEAVVRHDECAERVASPLGERAV